MRPLGARRETFQLDDAFAADPAARMTVTVFRPAEGPAEKLAVVVHGRNGAVVAPQMRELITPYLARGYAVVAPDTCNSEHNRSAGSGRDFTIDLHVRDAGRALAFAVEQATAWGWTGDGVALCGHSMGAYAVCRLAADAAPGSILHLIAASPFTSGKRQLEARARYHADGLAVLAAELPGALDDWPRHDVFAFVDRLTMPVGVVTGALDTITPAENVRELHEALPRPAGFVLLDGAQHCLEGGPHTETIGGLIDEMEAMAGQAPRQGSIRSA